jgi:hypothetical protein
LTELLQEIATSIALQYQPLFLPDSVPNRCCAIRGGPRQSAPPEGSKPLTEILRPIEARSDFAYFEEVELEDGKYKIEYFTKDGSKQKIEVDPLTGTQSQPAPAR